MRIETKFHATIEIDPAEKWYFPKGIPGFENETNFVLLPIEGSDSLQVLQSTNQHEVAFIVANPYTLVTDYTFELDHATIDLLEISQPEEIMVLGILSMKQPDHQSTINLQAPLIFHVQNKKAKQMILNDPRFTVRHPLDKGGN
ncbi:flagellar assembly protein FliW [Sporosarcina sp. P12(2017)]|uniref:flagellar assembly protein FliW n=1 Tax=unclassified Sporosarcina TaxID=2647733 RepID=UPI000C17219E|nr:MULTISPECIES: flagellar assembly protein FliW [unclassified Sporosarcina]PIC56258.1 flagellar assembly protein FliW [Sporosarcina sp. P10]PIC59502.1 flagellar assembly protein FliW [Sporosarcina sp. P12(2017)]